MKTTSITVERNYRIDNFDQYMKARLSHSVEPSEGETMEDATLRAIKQLDNVFRIAYPHVEEHLNFHVVRQVNGDSEIITTINHLNANPPNFYNPIPTHTSEEPIDKGFNLIDDINKAETLKKLKENQFLVKTNEEKKAYNNKLRVLEAREKAYSEAHNKQKITN